jgi:hypothetical protein
MEGLVLALDSWFEVKLLLPLVDFFEKFIGLKEYKFQ